MADNQFLKTMMDFAVQLKRSFSLYIEAEIDLTYPQWRVMKTIRYSKKDITAKEVADLLCSDKVTISDIVNRLLRKGYLTKKVDKKDRRRNVLSISEKAYALCKNVMCLEDNFNRTIFSTMDQEDVKNYIETTNELLNKMNNMDRRKE